MNAHIHHPQAVYLPGNNREPFRTLHAAGDDKVLRRRCGYSYLLLFDTQLELRKFSAVRLCILRWSQRCGLSEVRPFNITQSEITARVIQLLCSRLQCFIPFLCEQMCCPLRQKLKYLQAGFQQKVTLCKQIKADAQRLQVWGGVCEKQTACYYRCATTCWCARPPLLTGLLYGWLSPDPKGLLGTLRAVAVTRAPPPPCTTLWFSFSFAVRNAGTRRCSGSWRAVLNHSAERCW